VEIYERLYHEMDANNLMADPMFIEVGHEGCVGQAQGFIIYNHIGLENIREMLCGDVFHAYALRESDELNCDPATIENQEVVVNFFGYFISEEDFDWAFANKPYQEVWYWNYDPWEDPNGNTSPQIRMKH
jgi:hypothetical protein